MATSLLRSLSLRAALAAACLFSATAGAQGPPTSPPIAVAGPTVTLSASTSSTRVALTSATVGFNTVLVYNTGSVTAYVAAGGSSVVATTASTPVLAGSCVAQWSGSSIYVAGITGSSTASLLVQQWNGAPDMVCVSSGGGGSTTANQGTAAAAAGAWPVYLTDLTNLLGTVAHPVRTDPTGTTTQPVSAISLPLPAGAGTSANQATQITAEQAIQTSVASLDTKTPASPATAGNQSTANTSLSAIATSVASLDTKQPSKGSATSANSSPVVIASDQGPVPTTPAAATTGGASLYSAIVPNNTTGVLISTGAHTAYGMESFNNAATIAYVRLYDKATAPTCGTDTPIWRGMIPGTTGGAGFVTSFGAVGRKVTLGLGVCVTTGIADNDTGAPTASEYLVNVGYN